MSGQCSLSPQLLGILSSIIAIIVADNLDTSELNALGNFIMGIGQVILIIAAQEEILKSNKENEQDKQYITNQIELLKKQIELIQQKVN